MQQSDPYQPVIAWRNSLIGKPVRDPVELDVQDGRAEYVLSGPYRMAEGSKFEVVGGKVQWTCGNLRP